MQTTSSTSLNFEQLDHESSNSKLPTHLRFLRVGDQSEVKSLCYNCFPVTYPDQWYEDIVQDKKYFALAACDTSNERIVALIVANILPFVNCHREDQRILHREFTLTNTSVCYILVLGVVNEYRRQGLAGLLLDNLLQKLHSYESCKAIYLHVLHSNTHAIQFYQSKGFQCRLRLPYYYSIKGQFFDAFCFARYIHGKPIFVVLATFLRSNSRWLSAIDLERFSFQSVVVFNTNKSLSIMAKTAICSQF